MSYLLASAARATVGARSGQEDAYRVWPGEGVMQPAGNAGLLTVLADGMGGHRGGAIAGQTACATFTEAFAANEMPYDERLSMALHASNDALADEVDRNGALKGMGCTLIGAWFDDTGMRWTSVGDSLLLLYRFPDVIRLNEDHSLGSYLDEQARRNEISYEEARGNRHRNALRSALTGSKIDLIDLRGEPLQLMAGDWVVLASDGIASLDGDELADIMYRYREGKPEEMAEALIGAVEAKGMPEQDNTTVVAVRVEGASETVKTRQVTEEGGDAITLRTRRIGVVSGRKVLTPGEAQAKTKSEGRKTAAMRPAPPPPRSTFETLLTKGPVALLLAAGAAFVLAAAIFLFKASKTMGPETPPGPSIPSQIDLPARTDPTKQIQPPEPERAPQPVRDPDPPPPAPAPPQSAPPPAAPVQPAPKAGPGPSTGPETTPTPQNRSAPRPKSQTQTQSPADDPDIDIQRDPGVQPQEGGSPPKAQRKPDRIISAPPKDQPPTNGRKDREKKEVPRVPQ